MYSEVCFIRNVIQCFPSLYVCIHLGIPAYSAVLQHAGGDSEQD